MEKEFVEPRLRRLKKKVVETRFIRTKDAITPKGLAKLFGFRVIGTRYAVCDGEWRKQRNDMWRFWRNADL